MEKAACNVTPEKQLAVLEREVDGHRKMAAALEAQLQQRMGISSTQARWALELLFTALRTAFPSADTTVTLRSDEAFERVR